MTRKEYDEEYKELVRQAEANHIPAWIIDEYIEDYLPPADEIED